MQTGIESFIEWLATYAACTVAATLLSSCVRPSDTNELRAPAHAPTAYHHASDLYLDIDDGIVTVRAHDAPLHAVIEKLANQAGLTVLTKGRLEQRVTVELQSLTLMAALQELLRGFSFVLVDARDTTEARQDGRGTLWIFSTGLSDADVFLTLDGDTPAHAKREEHKSVDELSAALTDHDPNTRLDAVSELGACIDDEQAALMLANVASHDEHPSVRAEALNAIGGSRAGTNNALFARALMDRDASVRKAAISALESIGAQTSLQTLAIALKDRDASVRATAVDAIGEIGGDNARSLLESALGDESAMVREAAAERLMHEPVDLSRQLERLTVPVLDHDGLTDTIGSVPPSSTTRADN